MNLLSKLGLLILLGAIACNNTAKQQPASDSASQISIANMKLLDLNGQVVDFSQYKGKTVFINFWATWCKPCREEMPSIQKAMEILKNENIQFLFPSEESNDEIEVFKAAHGYNFNFVRVESLAELNIIGLPITFIFNPDGKLVFSEMGYRKWDDKANIDLIQSISNPK
ncbi:MAG TPA: TlpA disulfide reductase family protein [Chitinophagaceae bacterium]|nr:TlpA disulfide reductase family protein [Chitinophagaceae bacterium]